MSKGEAVSEPSMDEILSSIRKIIAEDEVETGPESAERDSSEHVAVDDGDDDILELTEDDETPTETALEPMLEGAEDAPAEAAEPAPVMVEDEPEQEAIAEVVDPLADIDEDVEADQPEAEAPQVDEDKQPDDEPLPAADETSEAAAVVMDEKTEVLLDCGTAAVASGALQRLSAAMKPGTAIPEGGRTIEAFLADLVRPELKSWLDEHLPGLVERIVEREIKKLVRDAQPD